MLCHFYPGYTLEQLRQLTLREHRTLVEVMNEWAEAQAGEG